MFEGFASKFVDTGDASIFTRYGGDGPAVLLLHGHPRTSATWHWVAPLLVDRGYTVVCPDLRGYGRSRGPAPTADHSAHCKRAVATDMLEVMRDLGHGQFSVVGHDRGSCVALRLALDYPPRSDHSHAAGRHPDHRASRPDHRQLRHPLLALVLLRPARDSRTSHQRRS